MIKYFYRDKGRSEFHPLIILCYARKVIFFQAAHHKHLFHFDADSAGGGMFFKHPSLFLQDWMSVVHVWTDAALQRHRCNHQVHQWQFLCDPYQNKTVRSEIRNYSTCSSQPQIFFSILFFVLLERCVYFLSEVFLNLSSYYLITIISSAHSISNQE